MEPRLSEDFGRTTHEMSNALAYVVTNLNLLTELVEQHSERNDLVRFENLIGDALQGSERLGELLRSLRRLHWGDHPPPPIEAQHSDPPTDPRGILVVDDEPAILAAVKRALRPHNVEVVTSGEEALERIRCKRYDLVLCDLIMGGISGMEVYRTLAAEHPDTAERVVFMTGGGFTPDIRMFLADVNNSILRKPFDVKTLRWVVGQRLSESANA